MNMQLKLETLTPLVEQYRHSKHFAGAVIGIKTEVDSGISSWGVAASPSEKMRNDSLFDLASLTKLFTASAIMRLVDTQRLSLYAKVLDILDYNDPRLIIPLRNLTVVSLLTHHSGLPAWYPLYTQRDNSLEYILSQMMEKTGLGRGMIYSDLNFILLGELVQRITGQSLDQAIGELVLKPLNLSETTYHPDPLRCVATEFGNWIEKEMVQERGLSFSGWRDESSAIRGTCNDGNAFYYFGGVAGHAGLFAPARDLLTFGWTFCKKDPTFLSPPLYLNALKDWGEGRGFGFQFGSLYPYGGFGHTGFTGTYLYVNPKRSIVITILTNRLHVPHAISIDPFRLDVVQTLVQA